MTTFIVYYVLNHRGQATSTISKQNSGQRASKQEITAEHDYQDVDFAKKMILVHQQAMQLADIGNQKASDIRIKELASNIYASSESDSQAYIALLQEWNESYLNLSDFPEMEGHDMYPTFPGMMKLSEIQQLRDLSSNEFDKAFLRLLIMNHEGVIELQTKKKNESSAVKYAGILMLREKNIQRQKEQIVQMKKIYKEQTVLRTYSP